MARSIDPLYQQIQTQLLAWAQTALRDLPWRQQRTPYTVWVSEIMLQQTRVETVIPYYERWVARFPGIAALAQADLGEALKYWEGLGYYARCRNLHRAARIVQAEHGGRLPETRAELLALPGIGPYTVGAILSLAFDQDAAVLDGNVRRVFSRLFALNDNPRNLAAREKLWALSRAILPVGNAGRFNEALMDLGATICTPRKPHCNHCPLNSLCQGYALGSPESYPRAIPRQKTPHYDVSAGVVWRNGRLLIAQRPLDGLLGGLWEFPGGKQERDETLQQCLERELLEELDIRVSVGQQITVVRHTYTHFRVTVYAFDCQYASAQDPKTLGVHDWRWVTMQELDNYAFPVVDRKIIDVLREPWRQTVFDLESKAEAIAQPTAITEETHDQKS